MSFFILVWCHISSVAPLIVTFFSCIIFFATFLLLLTWWTLILLSLPALIHWIRNFFPLSLVVFNSQISTKHFKILSVRLFVISRHIYKTWKKKLPLKWNFLYPLFANCFHVERCSFTFLNVNFFDPIVAIFQ